MRIAVFLVGSWFLYGADSPPMIPMRVCDLAREEAGYDGKPIAVLGRFSFRQTGRGKGERTVDEQKCGDAPGFSLKVAFDRSTAPPTPEHLDFDSGAVNRLLKLVQSQTALAKFKFGTPDYDRWAVVYGRFDAGKFGEKRIVCAGDSVVLFLVDRY